VHSILYVDWGGRSIKEKVAFMEKVKEALVKSGDHTNAGYANSMIAAMYEEEGEHLKAIGYIRENIAISQKTQDVIAWYRYSSWAYRLFKESGNNALAVAMADTLFRLKDSILRTQQRDIVLALEAKYENEKKEKEIALQEKEIDLLNSQNALHAIRLLHDAQQREALMRENSLKDSVLEQGRVNTVLLLRENELKNAELKKGMELAAAVNRESELKAAQLVKERNFRGVLVAGTGLLLSAGFGMLFLYTRQRKKNRVIQKQSADLQVLLKEIHHRVKNNLQVISSLLDLQSLTISDNQASEAVKEGKNRVQSMALIHQNLYSEDNLKGIRARDYIGNLLKSLCDSYNINPGNVKLHAEIDDLKLDVDTMIPLGLILNELVSNSLKYAFRDGSSGELSIILKEMNDQLFLKVKDNGTGFPDGVNTAESKSFGMKMIRAFAQKLKARLDIYNQDGANVEMHITKYNLA
jgi:two-component sensor histidine kinase